MGVHVYMSGWAIFCLFPGATSLTWKTTIKYNNNPKTLQPPPTVHYQFCIQCTNAGKLIYNRSNKNTLSHLHNRALDLITPDPCKTPPIASAKHNPLPAKSWWQEPLTGNHDKVCRAWLWIGVVLVSFHYTRVLER